MAFLLSLTSNWAESMEELNSHTKNFCELIAIMRLFWKRQKGQCLYLWRALIASFNSYMIQMSYAIWSSWMINPTIHSAIVIDRPQMFLQK